MNTAVLSKRHLEREGYTAENVEKYNHFTRRRKDLFGFADLIAFREGETVLVQVTSRGNLSSRRKKILASEIAHKWIMAGNSIVLHGWDQPGGPKTRYRLKQEIVVP